MLARILSLFTCPHSRLGWVRTDRIARPGVAWRTCLSCGKEIAYDLKKLGYSPESL